MVEAWIGDNKVAETLTQTHLGRSVYALEIPFDSTTDGCPRFRALPFDHGGENGDTVEFRLEAVVARQTGTWYEATDQELDLTAPCMLRHDLDIPGLEEGCLGLGGGWDLCAEPELIPPAGLEVLPREVDPPVAPPRGLRILGSPVELELIDLRSGERVSDLDGLAELRISYLDADLDAAGIAEEKSLAMYVLEGKRWAPAGQGEVQAEYNRVVTALDHASVFALMGASGDEPPPPRFIRGDCNGDGRVAGGVTDAVFLLCHLFLGTCEPPCRAACDANGDGRLPGSVTDAVYLLSHLFLGGPPPPPPYPQCGPASGADLELGCEHGPEECLE
jgi:hypothetical protein